MGRKGYKHCLFSTFATFVDTPFQGSRQSKLVLGNLELLPFMCMYPHQLQCLLRLVGIFRPVRPVRPFRPVRPVRPVRLARPVRPVRSLMLVCI